MRRLEAGGWRPGAERQGSGAGGRGSGTGARGARWFGRPRSARLEPRASSLKPHASSLEPRASRRGFTLLEILVALGILGSSLVILLTNIFHSIEMYRVAQGTLLAGFLAQEKFTELVNAKSGVSVGDFKDGTFEKAPGYAWRYR
ncbi:MAG: prepilin-type N-terminal cleavage/methylation domain-containing protein, partial [Candidatus Riflebacteria bacterium]|nr:prepilin-type N-terminal cleavage/methylation domain-containing protein [Candidatus Riflebacteria bacterium]